MFDLTHQRLALQSAYPERRPPPEGWWDRQGARVASPVARWLRANRCAGTDLLPLVERAGRPLRHCADHRLRETAAELRVRLRREGVSTASVAEAFALVREVAGRTLGQRHYDVQLLGGWVLLNGCIAEMATGEGKTLTATLAAATAALAGVPVHVITVNDYLTQRDAETMQPVYAMLGLTVGSITAGLSPAARRAAYHRDITYCCNKELAFDYLKDRLAVGSRTTRLHLNLDALAAEGSRLRHLVLRGLCFGIVDEADSVLVDEARVPLIIAGAGGEVVEHALYETAIEVARQLTRGQHFLLHTPAQGQIRLTASGERWVAERTQRLGGLWSGPRRRHALMQQALTALHVFHRDVHYLVRDQKVMIIDEYTGRVMEDRSWEQGLHQMIEVKEGCPLTPLQQSLARLTVQRFFRRYLWLSGMTGTAQEVASELWNVYQLATVPVPTHRPVQRVCEGERVFATAAEKWEAVVDRIGSVHGEGRPVLVGTRSVQASERLSAHLRDAKLPHVVLNALQNKEEATIVAAAGLRGRITVATNMAGRGTDIKIPREVAAAGGLHVMATERHDAARIDRQLYGRASRQGEPGSFETLVSLEDDLLVSQRGRLWYWVARWLVRPGRPRSGWLARFVVRRAQVAAERLHARVRRDVCATEDRLESALAFAGRGE